MGFWASIVSIIFAVISGLAAILNVWFVFKNDKLSQASEVSIWPDKSGFSKKESNGENRFCNEYIINNSSDSPIYNMFVIQHSNNDHSYNLDSLLEISSIPGFCDKYFEEIVPPGNFKITLDSNGAATGNEHDVASILFTDSKGTQWFRHANGTLEKKQYIGVLRQKGFLLKHV
ncbi:MAG: hypothetical protein ABF741_01560 [Liquorilactobacillus ghanensis]|uniref:hypothetical protein n=1 Tax=Liquorilactobacillus ghanensis TaxID=399370 RepID=UPI0039EABA3E